MWNKTKVKPPTEMDEYVVALSRGVITGNWVPLLLVYFVVAESPDEYPYWIPACPLPNLKNGEAKY